MNNISFLSKGELYVIQKKQLLKINCESIEQYKRNLQEIRTKKEWKKDSRNDMESLILKFNNAESKASVEGVKFLENGDIIYSANLGVTCAIYTKGENDIEELIIRDNNFVVHEFDYYNENIIASASINSLERHLLLINSRTKDYSFLTEGDSKDLNPIFSPINKDEIYYDSCGLGYNANGNIVGFSPRSIVKLNTSENTIEEIIQNENFDYFKPKFDSNNNLYYIRRPYKINEDTKFSIKDLFMLPVKLFKAIFRWLDFFTQKYTGETLTTSGSNPSKIEQKSEEELFIEDNLINVTKTFDESLKSKEKYPGIIPNNWELIKFDGKNETVISKGIMDFDISSENKIIVSNGKNILILDENGQKEKLAVFELAAKLNIM